MPSIFRGVANAFCRSPVRVLLCLLVMALPLFWAAVWGPWPGTTEPKPPARNVPPPRGWYWVDEPMKLRAFFEKERIDPTRVTLLVKCDGAITDFKGPASAFGDYVANRAPGKGFEHWTKTSYSWDAWAWTNSQGDLKYGGRDVSLSGLVMVRFAEDKPTRTISGFDIYDGYSEYWGCSWVAPPENHGPWAEIDAKYGAVYGHVYETHEDISPDHKVFRIRTTDGQAWVREIGELLARTHQLEWAAIFRYRLDPPFSSAPHPASEGDYIFMFDVATRTAELYTDGGPYPYASLQWSADNLEVGVSMNE